MMDGGWAGGGSWLWMLGGLLLVIAVVILVVWLVMRASRVGQPPTESSSRSTPDQILGERFARGEITSEEFDRARKALNPDR